MYNAHRGMVPAPNNRLTELLDQVRAEFESQQSRNGEYEQNSTFASFLSIRDYTALLHDLLHTSHVKCRRDFISPERSTI